MYFMLQITINASVRRRLLYATGTIPTNHPCLATFYTSARFGGWHHFFKLAFPPLTLKRHFHGGFTSVARSAWKPLDQWEHSF
jgi:hypothetical protein